jgi:ribosomal protein S18 acetylase RimI-like enzyme
MKTSIINDYYMKIREAKLEDAAAIAKVHVDTWKTTYSDILPKDYIQGFSYQKRENHGKNCLGLSTDKKTNYFIYVAENAEREIIGFVEGGLERSSESTEGGEIYTIYLLKAYQRQGIGRSLVRLIATKLSRSSLTSLVVWVLADNPAIQFYQSLGGKKVAQKPIDFGTIELKEIAYGRDDTQILIDRTFLP